MWSNVGVLEVSVVVSFVKIDNKDFQISVFAHLAW